MAKQSSLFKLRGKADGQSFYYSKNGEYLTRKINPGMSSRVKTAEEYANTRLNNKEFGAAGSCAGVMIRTVSKRWRYILDSIATGMLVKAIKEAMVKDNTHDWGKRQVLLTDMPAIQDQYNRFSKNEMLDVIKINLDSQTKYDSSNNKLVSSESASLNAELVAQLQALGADSFICTAYIMTVHAPTIGADGESYIPAASILAEIDEKSGNLVDGTVILDLDDSTVTAGVQNSAASFGGVLVVFQPTKTINSKTHVLQQHCSAYWKSIASIE